MDLRLYVDNIRQQLAVAAEAGGDDARALAEETYTASWREGAYTDRGPVREI